MINCDISYKKGHHLFTRSSNRFTITFNRKWFDEVQIMRTMGKLCNSCLLCAQSSALGFLLAQKHFTNPLVAVPSAVSVVCMAVRLCTLLFSYTCSCATNLVYYTPNIILFDVRSSLPCFTAWWKCSSCVLEESTNSC